MPEQHRHPSTSSRWILDALPALTPFSSPPIERFPAINCTTCRVVVAAPASCWPRRGIACLEASGAVSTTPVTSSLLFSPSSGSPDLLSTQNCISHQRCPSVVDHLHAAWPKSPLALCGQLPKARYLALRFPVCATSWRSARRISRNCPPRNSTCRYA